jgi:hypothetical protein
MATWDWHKLYGSHGAPGSLGRSRAERRARAPQRACCWAARRVGGSVRGGDGESLGAPSTRRRPTTSCAAWATRGPQPGPTGGLSRGGGPGCHAHGSKGPKKRIVAGQRRDRSSVSRGRAGKGLLGAKRGGTGRHGRAARATRRRSARSRPCQQACEPTREAASLTEKDILGSGSENQLAVNLRSARLHSFSVYLAVVFALFFCLGVSFPGPAARAAQDATACNEASAAPSERAPA